MQHPSPGTIFNVPNLIEDREYDFRVIAVNEAGESRPTETSRTIKVKDPKGSVTNYIINFALHQEMNEGIDK